MNATEYFRKALTKLLEERPRGTQGQVADQLEINRSRFNDLIKGRKNLSLDKMEQIASALGTNYIDMLILGRNLAEQESPAQNGISSKVTPLNHQESLSPFRDKETARRLIKMLGVIEKKDRELFRKIEGYIEANYELARVKKAKKRNQGNG